ncbi:hypothetical protein C1940_16875 (plasmid) [Lactiplantibacillus plantarum subsp. plantarum]|uniref:hypothetical protein n=1 Tax=Lactiplantibacillus plantarum TaxID=1590 RepID=UPI000CD34DEC|nr:hypothetical protein [Lactiplantibacillus plantarum]AUV74129.1 hypothetical protein C1940_16875 [Lactiplantibacillus plantarum subsp. plantarum]
MDRTLKHTEIFCLSHAYLNVINSKATQGNRIREVDMVFSDSMLNVVFDEKSAIVKTCLEESCMNWLKMNGDINKLRATTECLNNGMSILTSSIKNFETTSNFDRLLTGFNLAHTVNVLGTIDDKLLILDQAMPMRINNKGQCCYSLPLSSALIEDSEFVEYKLMKNKVNYAEHSIQEIYRVIENSISSVMEFWRKVTEFVPKLSKITANRIALSMIDSGYVSGKFLFLKELKNVDYFKGKRYEANLNEFEKYLFQFRMILFTYGLGQINHSMEKQSKERLNLVCQNMLTCENKLIESVLN